MSITQYGFFKYSSIVIYFLFVYEIYEDYLSQQNQRKSIFELLVHRLVMPDLHAQQCADAATNDSK
jgi:hypothetical protein